MTSKIRVKVGQIEVEFEGSEEYIKSELPRAIKSICSSLPDMVEAEANTAPQAAVTGQQNPEIQMTTSNIVEKLGFKTQHDLVLAACARLELVENHSPFSRGAMLHEMKTATNHYTDTIAGNLSSYLTRLVSQNKLIKRASGEYALSAVAKKGIEEKLGMK